MRFTKERMYLVAYSILLLRAFLLTTALDIVIPLFITTAMRWLAYIILLMTTAIDYKIETKLFVIGVIMMIIALLVKVQSSYSIALDYAFCSIFGTNVRFRKVAYVYVLISCVFTVMFILAALAGQVENYTYVREGRVRASMGFVYPTDFAAHIYFIGVGVLYLLYKKLKLWHGLLFFLTALIIYEVTDARGPCAMIALSFIVCYTNKVFMQHGNSLFPRWFLRLSTLFAAAITFILVLKYRPDNPIWKAINQISSNRLSLAVRQMSQYKLFLFGQYLLQKGNGHGIMAYTTNTGYTYIDLSFLRVLLLYGIVWLLFLIIYSVLLNSKAIRNNDYKFLVLMLLTSFYSITAQHFFDFAYNFLLIGYYMQMESDPIPIRRRGFPFFGKRIVFSGLPTRSYSRYTIE